MLAKHLSDFDSLTGAFVFVISDFFDESLLQGSLWGQLFDDGFDPVPVLVQDPVWEQTFLSEAGGLLLPFRDSETGLREWRRYSKRDARAQKQENEGRLARIRNIFQDAGLDWIELGTADPHTVNDKFMDWSDERKQGRYR